MSRKLKPKTKKKNDSAGKKRAKKILKTGSVDGRPKIEINFTTAESLCGLQCTGEEMAAVLQVSYDTFVKRIKQKYGLTFSEYFKKHSATGIVSLRRRQYQVAMGGKPSMLIWLGKQWLGQREVVENIYTDPIPVEIVKSRKRRPEDTGESGENP